MRRIPWVATILIGLSLVATGLLALRPLAHARSTAQPQEPAAVAGSCSNATLSGSYGGYAWGSSGGVLNNNVELFTFDGTGNLTFIYWSMVGGKYQNGSGSGTYSIASNCTGYFTISGGTWYAIVNSGGTEVDLVEGVSTSNISQVIKKQ